MNTCEIKDKLDDLRQDVDKITELRADIDELKLLILQQQDRRVYEKPRRYFCCYSQDAIITNNLMDKQESSELLSENTEKNSISKNLSRTRPRRKVKKPCGMKRSGSKFRNFKKSMNETTTFSFTSISGESGYNESDLTESPNRSPDMPRLSGLSLSSGFMGDGGSSVTDPSVEETPGKSVRFSI